MALSQDLPVGARKLLHDLVRQTDGGADVRTCIASLAKSNAMGRNNCRRYLDRLLKVGLVMIRPWIEPTTGVPRALGYDFLLIIDAEDRADAVRNGFVSTRPMRDQPRDAWRGIA